MYVKGSNNNTAYKSEDHSFYRGIVINNEDLTKRMRVQIFIPELSNQPEPLALQTSALRYPGYGPLTKDMVFQLKELLPWAEQCAPLMGEAGGSHYFAPEGEQKSKATYVEDKTKQQTPEAYYGMLQPREQISMAASSGGTGAVGAGQTSPVADAWADGTYGKTNTTGGTFAPKNSGPSASGVYGVPPVGSHVWVFHHRGDLNFPIYFGVSPSLKDTGLVWNNDDQTYPSTYESAAGDTPPEPGQPTRKPGSSVEEYPPGSLNASGYRATAYGNVYENGTPGNPRGNGRILDRTTQIDINKGDIKWAWQWKGNKGNDLIPGYSVASNKFPHGTRLLINGKEYRVDDTGGMSNNVIDFYAGGNRQMYNRFAVMKIDTIEVLKKDE